MRTCVVVIASLLAFGCGKSAEDRAREDSEAEAKKAGNPDPKPTSPSDSKPEPKLSPKKEKVEAPPPDPEPTTPAELEAARKKAMNEGRTKDVLRYCDQSNLDDKSDPQIRLGCTFAACREKDAERAQKWGKSLEKKYKDNAIRPCATAGISL
ncbi:MAG: hypothetical protein KF773_02060 [Deltaproteobacteria bacterium]|nr:hypothetical protein [Deltaproteobacteria bacterium]MCW5806292.1 hypothetical protein [Deltaproteobacteria bacterium]